MALNMDYDNYIELYEAVCFFDKIYCSDNKILQPINKEEINRLGINNSVYTAVMRILVVTNMLDYNGGKFVLTNIQKEKHRHILDNIISKRDNANYIELFSKAINEFEFFFDRISKAEYDVYSRYNFNITFNIGKKIVKYTDFSDGKILELGGNSGGLGTAILTKNKDCSYTVVDTKIPCMIGNELKKTSMTTINFVEGNVFNLTLPDKIYKYILIMNLLHDFDDVKCLKILNNCKKYYDNDTKFYIIEDVLTGEFEPKEAIMHGLRLSVSCRGGKQRTIEEFKSLFSNIGYKLEKAVKIDNVHTMLIMGAISSLRNCISHT